MALAKTTERIADAIGDVWSKGPWIALFGGLLWAERQAPGTRPRDRTDQFLHWLGQQSVDVREHFRDAFNQLRQTLQAMAIGTVIAAGLSVATAAFVGSMKAKAIIEVGILSILYLGYWFAYVHNLRLVLESAAGVGYILAGKRITTFLRAVNKAAQDFGTQTGDARFGALLDDTRGAFSTLGESLKDGVDIFSEWAIGALRRPMRIVAWYGAGTLVLIIGRWNEHWLAYVIGLGSLVVLLSGLHGWSRQQRNAEGAEAPKVLIRLATWLILFAALPWTWVLHAQQPVQGLSYVLGGGWLYIPTFLKIFYGIFMLTVLPEFALYPSRVALGMRGLTRSVSAVAAVLSLSWFLFRDAMVGFDIAFKANLGAGFVPALFVTIVVVAVIGIIAAIANKEFLGAALVPVVLVGVMIAFLVMYGFYKWLGPDIPWGMQFEQVGPSAAPAPGSAQDEAAKAYAARGLGEIWQTMSPRGSNWPVQLEANQKYKVWFTNGTNAAIKGIQYDIPLPMGTVALVNEDRGAILPVRTTFRNWKKCPLPNDGVGRPYVDVGKKIPIYGIGERTPVVIKATKKGVAEIGPNLPPEKYWRRGWGQLVIHFERVSINETAAFPLGVPPLFFFVRLCYTHYDATNTPGRSHRARGSRRRRTQNTSSVRRHHNLFFQTLRRRWRLCHRSVF